MIRNKIAKDRKYYTEQCNEGFLMRNSQSHDLKKKFMEPQYPPCDMLKKKITRTNTRSFFKKIMLCPQTLLWSSERENCEII